MQETDENRTKKNVGGDKGAVARSIGDVRAPDAKNRRVAGPRALSTVLLKTKVLVLTLEARQKQIKYEINFAAAGFFITYGYMTGKFRQKTSERCHFTSFVLISRYIYTKYVFLLY